MPSSLIIAAAGVEATSLAAAAITLAVRVATVIAVNSLIAKEQPNPGDIGTTGGRVQLPPATDNKLPVIYGTAFTSPIITDAKISSDQQEMWYVLTFSEATSGSVTFGDIYWDDKVLLFSESNPSEIEGWYNPNDNTRVTGVAGKISMWFYKNGSAVGTTHRCRGLGGTGTTQGATTIDARTLLQDAGIPAANRWTSTDTMSDTVFAVLRVKYDADHGITGLGQIRAQVQNTLGNTSGATNGTGPGSVIKDYLTNERYGAGVPLANIDTASLDALDAFSYANGAFTITDTDGNIVTNTYRYRITGPIDTAKDCLTNLTEIANCCDSWIQWNELNGKWGVVINQSLEQAGGSTSTMTVVTADQIIGGINVTPTDLNSMGNAIRVNFPNERIIDQTDFRYYSLDANLISANEPINEINYSIPLVNNSVQATWLGYKRLWSSRSDIAINFTMDYSGIKIDAGDIITVKHEWYGWGVKEYGNQIYPGKPFRVTQVRESKSEDGFLSAQISALEYNDDIYNTTNPHFFTPVSFSGISDPSYISPPGTPVVVSTASNYFTLSSTVPTVGNVLAMEFWYSNSAAISGNNYTLYTTQQNANKSLYTPGATETVTVVNLPAGTYFWRTRAQGENSNSDFSPASNALIWSPTSGPVNGNDILDNSIPGSKVTSGDPAKTGQKDSGGFFDTLGPIAIGGLALATGWALWEKGLPWFGKDEEKKGGGQGGGLLEAGLSLEADKTNAQVGDTVTFIIKSGPDYGDINQYIG